MALHPGRRVLYRDKIITIKSSCGGGDYRGTAEDGSLVVFNEKNARSEDGGPLDAPTSEEASVEESEGSSEGGETTPSE